MILLLSLKRGQSGLLKRGLLELKLLLADC